VICQQNNTKKKKIFLNVSEIVKGVFLLFVVASSNQKKLYFEKKLNTKEIEKSKESNHIQHIYSLSRLPLIFAFQKKFLI